MNIISEYAIKNNGTFSEHDIIDIKYKFKRQANHRKLHYSSNTADDYIFFQTNFFFIRDG